MVPIKFVLEVFTLQAQDNCYFFLSTKPITGKGWRDHAFKWPVKRSKLKAFFKKYSDINYHLYFCPLPFSGNKRRRDLVIGSSLLWADLDEANPRTIIPIPSIAWETSPGRYSCLWRLKKFYNCKEIEEVNRNVTYVTGADKAGWDLTQVLRIPGTINLKYDTKPRSKFLWWNDKKFSIKDMPKFISTPDYKKTLKKVKGKIKPSTMKLLKTKVVTEGKRSDVIWRLNNELHEQGLNGDEVYVLIKNSNWNKFAGRHDEERQLRREIEKVGAKQPSAKEQLRKEYEDEDFSVKISTIKREMVHWLWYPYIARGKVTLLEGDPGVGKSYLTLAIASALSNSQLLPEQPKSLIGKTLLLSGEDGPGDTIRPRLEEVGANLDNIWVVNHPVIFDEDGCEEIEEAIIKIKPKLVIVDPLNTYLADVDTHKASETRVAMHRVLKLAERTSVAMVCIRHFTKSSRDKSLYRGQGSIELAAVARSIIQVGRDPHDDDGRAMCHIKNNLGPLGKAIGFEFSFPSNRPFKWTGLSNLTVEDIMNAKSEGVGHSSRAEATKFLIENVNSRPIHLDELLGMGEAVGIDRKKILGLRRELKIKQTRKNNDRYWSRPKS